jgi:hypothetical protein
MRFSFIALAILSAPLHAATLADWHETFNDPAIQQTIMTRACRVSASAAGVDKDGRIRFGTGTSWTRLAEDRVFIETPVRALVVVCEKGRGETSVNAASVLLRETADPVFLTDGYARRERPERYTIPGLERVFVAVERAYEDAPTAYGSGLLIDLTDPAQPKTVWSSPPRFKNVRWGVAEISGQSPSELVLKNTASEVTYQAFQWSGDRFSPYDTFESRLKALPETAFVFGGE